MQEVSGTATKHTQNNIYMYWESPISGETCWAQGELYLNPYTKMYEHIVFDDEDNALYKVVAQE